MSKVIIVGPSGKLKDQKIGNKIDEFDVVCRINWGGRLESMNGEYKEIIGSKKNIWFCGHAGLVNMFPLSFYNSYDKVVIHNLEIYEANKSRINNLELCNKEIINNCNKEMFEFNGFDRVPTTGMLTIFYILSKYNDITICGFDGHHGGHFYGNRYMDNQEKSNAFALKGFGRHNVIKEREYFNYLVSIGKIKNYE
tara:strand:- start:22 stop:609 length:588 start_codon:yes stop_codon:yes gene_type:complete